MIKKILNKIFYNHVAVRVMDIVLSPFTFLSCVLLLYLRKNWAYLPVSERIYNLIGIFPIKDHYYEPMFNASKEIKESLRLDRSLPGLDFNIEAQLELLSKLEYSSELSRIPEDGVPGNSFFFNNGFFSHGDAEFYYNIIRHFRPLKIIEIGSGNSTLIAEMAASKNCVDFLSSKCEITCIEPYEMKWLENMDVIVKRDVVENIPVSFFSQLNKNDILFIDSSHMIRPQGDVLYELLEILPTLKPGVLIHIHDIFTPKNYPDQWIIKDHRFWNEQYLLEAFLSCNKDFTIVGSLNYLHHNHRSLFFSKMILKKTNREIEPASFWIIKN